MAPKLPSGTREATQEYYDRLYSKVGGASSIRFSGGFAKRGTVTGSPSDHATGKAIDVFQTGGLSSTQGILIAETALTLIGTGYVIWDNWIISANTGWKWCPYAKCGGSVGRESQTKGPTARHEDHVHISVYPGSIPKYEPHPNRSRGMARFTGSLDLNRYGTKDLELARKREAFLQMIAFAEGTEKAGDSGYNVLFGYELFNSYAAHPNRKVTRGGLTSTAAGRYQFLYDTWQIVAKATKVPDFSPASQDRGVIHLLDAIRRPALSLLDQGKIEQAILATRGEWASFPTPEARRYGQGGKTMAQMLAAYNRAYGDGIGFVDSDDHGGYFDSITGQWIPGDIDIEISKLQKFLEIEANGKFDKKTFEALKAKLTEAGRSDLDIVINGQTLGVLGLRWVP